MSREGDNKGKKKRLVQAGNKDREGGKKQEKWKGCLDHKKKKPPLWGNYQQLRARFWEKGFRGKGKPLKKQKGIRFGSFSYALGGQRKT